MTENISYQHISNTVSQISRGIILASLASVSLNFTHNPPDGINAKAYIRESLDSSFDNYTNPFTGQFVTTDLCLENIMINFYSTLLASQESLGKEFGEILHKNRWNLYEN